MEALKVLKDLKKAFEVEIVKNRLSCRDIELENVDTSKPIKVAEGTGVQGIPIAKYFVSTE